MIFLNDNIYNSIKITCLEINLQKDVNNFFMGNYKILLREIKEGLNKGRCIPISQIRILIIVKMLFIPNLIHGFIPYQNPPRYICE